MNVIVFCAHGDDEVLGAGGSISKHVREMDNVSVAFIKRFKDNRTKIQDDNISDAKKILGYNNLIKLNVEPDNINPSDSLISMIDAVIDDIKPDLIYGPWMGDLHQDHRSLFYCLNSATRHGLVHFTKNVLLYEIPSSTDQGIYANMMPFKANFFNVIDIQDVETKMKAFNVYTTEQTPMRNQDTIHELSKRRGVHAGAEYAEAFYCARYVND